MTPALPLLSISTHGLLFERGLSWRRKDNLLAEEGNHWLAHIRPRSHAVAHEYPPDLSVTAFAPSASPRSERVENVERMAEAGASAVVFHSLFSEQCDRELDHVETFKISPNLYCEHIRAAKNLVPIPIIGSLNITGSGAWFEAARRIE